MSEDAELVQQVAAGDRQAFLALYDRYAARVHALSLRMLGESMAAEEVTQDAFLKLWTRASSFVPDRGSLLTWLLTIARRTALDRIRLESRRPALAEPPNAEGSWDDLPDAAGGTDEARWRSLRFAVNDLPVEQRRVIELAFYHGLSHSQISNELDVPLGTVKTRLRLGMEKLRHSWLAGEGGTKRSEAGLSGVSSHGDD